MYFKERFPYNYFILLWVYFCKEKVTKHIDICLTSNECVPTTIDKWNAKLCDTLPNVLCVQDVFKMCFRTTIDSAVNNYNKEYSIEVFLLNIILRKSTLHSFTFCNDMSESIQHVFATCKKIKVL